jgi:hypothetical protein
MAKTTKGMKQTVVDNVQIVTNLTIVGHYMIVPKKVPEFVVPDLTDFEVSFPFFKITPPLPI